MSRRAWDCNDMSRRASDCSEMPMRASDCSDMPRDASDCSDISRRASDCREMSRNTSDCREMSRHASNCRDMSRDASDCSEMSRETSDCREMSMNTSDCREMSRNTSDCSEMSRVTSDGTGCLDMDGMEEFRIAGSSTYLRIDLDIISENFRVIKKMCSPKTEVMAALKGNAHGHGSCAVARHLHDQNGCQHFAVAAPLEGVQLRKSGLQDFILVFGSNIEAVKTLQQYDLTPTVSSLEFLKSWAALSCQDAEADCQTKRCPPPVVLKVDTGMSRNGCLPHELPDLVKFCQDREIPIHSVMTHFAQAWDDQDFTQRQLKLFLEVTKTLRGQGVRVHTAATPSMLRGVGVDMDFVRVGVALYGLPPDKGDEAVDMTSRLGLRPAMTWLAHPVLLKDLPAGRSVGYDQTYRLQESGTIACFNFGYYDGYDLNLSNSGILTTMSGDECPVVGRISMDTITVSVKRGTSLSSRFVVLADDFTSPNCVVSLARQLNTVTVHVIARLSERLTRVYVTGGKAFTHV